MRRKLRWARLPWLTLAVVALAWLLSAASPRTQGASALTYPAISQGELWRLWSGHLVHFGAAHLRGDLLAFVLWAGWLEREQRALLARILLFAAPLLSLSILAYCGSGVEYRGLSALDCSLVLALIYRSGWQRERSRGLGLLCLTGFIAKCGYELLIGRALLAPDLGAGVRLLPLSHVEGAALGVLFARNDRR